LQLPQSWFWDAKVTVPHFVLSGKVLLRYFSQPIVEIGQRYEKYLRSLEFLEQKEDASAMLESCSDLGPEIPLQVTSKV